MLENSKLPENPSTATSNQNNEEVAGGGEPASVGFEEEDRAGLEEGYRNWAGNRWPRQETLALLKIRSDMDAEFKEASIKVPLWQEVSRKMGELGHNRTAKKCKEKFENIYKYHRRTKESGRPNGKAYRFFEQLEALDHHDFELPPPPASEKVQTSVAEIATNPTNVVYNAIPCSSIQHPDSSFVENSSSTTSSSSKESEGTHKKKRRLTEFFERMMNEVIDKQENLQKKFVEVLEKHEQDRIAREEAWKMQELARIKREREILVQERSVAAAKDAAVLAFLQKFSEQSGTMQFPEQAFSVHFPAQPPSSMQFPEQPSPVQLPEQPPSGQFPEQSTPVQLPVNSQADTFMDKQEKTNDANVVHMSLDKQERNNGRSYMHMSSSRWPKEEVEALIKIRADFDLQYQESGPKGPLWEEISAAMVKLGYDRSAKRCKEKWENINKYYRRIKESNKKRPEDSKTCGYVRLLDALHNKKTNSVESQVNSTYELKPEELLMHMMGGQAEQHQPETVTEDGDSENVDQIQGDDENADGDGYQIASGNPSSMAIMS
ncbi:unnamed protein product [Prunus armeniaca]|uniref:Myb-like domain-containing protein n=1 Tax=Prunus armeniaca TaxID=36596 RepID=A0A6J5XIB8_PRUAR|nr:hypothetical protein GBA52_020327 [Prunus armeniaca]CAB4313439.1 unnamed protein product [Prunus armeniaca]